jgi:hypothetical protein
MTSFLIRTQGSKTTRMYYVLEENGEDDDGIPTPEVSNLEYVSLTTHPDAFGVKPVPLLWGSAGTPNNHTYSFRSNQSEAN